MSIDFDPSRWDHIKETYRQFWAGELEDEFLGDAFPRFNLSVFGPGVLAAMLEACLDNSSGRVWFWPAEEKLRYLEQILSLSNLNGIQWVHGDGKPNSLILASTNFFKNEEHEKRA